jgi:hypothetical protein
MPDPVTASAGGDTPAAAPAAAPAQPADAPATPSEPAAAPADGTSLLGGGTQPAAADKPAEGDTPPAAGDTPKDGEDKDGDKTAPTPEDYGDFTFPDGFQVDDTALGEFKTLAASMSLTKDQAQKLVDFRAAQHQQHMAALDRQAERWVQDARADKEFGGNDFAKNIAIADRAVATYGTPELRALLNQYGLGNHPELVRFAYRVGQTVTEPGPVNTTSPQSGSADHAEILYPSNSK